MEHVIQLGINLDDEAITNAVVRDAKNKIIDALARDVRSELGITGNRYNRSEIAEEIADAIMERCREDIVRQTVERLADTLPRRKWYRDAVLASVAGASDGD